MMKSLIKNTVLIISMLTVIGVNAQVPDLVNYQAVVRNALGLPLNTQAVSVRFSIHQGSPTGTVVFTETQPTSTNQFGLINLELGSANNAAFSAINWGTGGAYYLQIEVDAGSGFDDLGASQLLSVPYALFARSAATGAQGYNSLIDTVSATLVECPTGGYKVLIGLDANASTFLEAGEITSSFVVCNGSAGAANQTLSINLDTLFLSNGGSIILPAALGDSWGTDVVNTLGGNITGDGTAGNPIVVIDNDTSSTNELELPMIGNTTGDVIIWNGSAWVAGIDSIIDNDSDPTNEIELPATAVANQVLTWNGSAWVAQNAGAGADNWGSQVVVTAGANFTGDGTAGTPLTLTEGDPSTTNEIQSLSTAGNAINISGSTGTTISTVAPAPGDYLYWNGTDWVSQPVPAGSDNQDLQLAGNSLSLTNDPTPVDLSPFMDNTDAQTLTYVSASQSLSISNGNAVTLVIDDADNDPTNEIELPATAVTGDLLTYSAGAWGAQAPPALSAALWNTNGPDIYNANTGKVGVGMISPTAVLDVQDSSVSGSATIFNVGYNLGGSVFNVTNDEKVNIRFPSGLAPLNVAVSGSTPEDNGIIVKSFNANNHAIFAAQVAGNGTGDPQVSFNVIGQGGWSIGADNSLGSDFVISGSKDGLGIAPRVVIDYASGNVGIGEINPQDELHITGSTPVIRLQDNDSPVTNVSAEMTVYDQAGILTFSVGQTTIGGRIASWGAGEDLHFQADDGTGVNTRMKISGANGFVGIGQVGIPTALLTVQPKFGTTASSIANFNNGSFNNMFDFAYDAANNSYMRMSDGGGTNIIELNTSGDSWLNGGNVGIGTTSPVGALDVNGEINNNARSGAANLVPVAYGQVGSGGAISNAGTGNWTVVYNGTGSYTITITAESVIGGSHIVGLTMYGTSGFITYQAFAGPIIVSTTNTGGTVQNSSFNFIVYKP